MGPQTKEQLFLKINAICKRKGITERKFYDLPISEQRYLLDLPIGQNPPKPEFFEQPDNLPIPPPIRRLPSQL